MYKIFMYFVLICAFFVSAQSTNLTGTVSNKNGKPIKGAIVTLSVQKLADTTDTQGAFSITIKTSVDPTRIFQPTSDEISLNKGVLIFSLAKAAPISIMLFDIRGNLLEREFNYASMGKYQFNLTNRPFASNIMLIRASIGGHTSSFRWIPMDNGMHDVLSSKAAQSSGGKLAKMQAAVDSISVTAAGYMSKGMAITTYTQPVNITLDTNTSSLPHFSFFVTSLKALQDLSKSQNGFGGDLRFGKTGQGAGLLGADSICSCIAERSMPGSKVKIWRAFLSVTKDVNGNQVNAIERIGQGPWYDRLDRLVANNVTELLNDRPKNCDADIQNDLPNEDGIPNHTPDPMKSAVDDHLTITGSGSDGKLYTGGGGGFGGGFGGGGGSSTNSTCDDWTSTTSSSKPRAGLSWPRQGAIGMQNWISVWDMSGCQAGIDLDESTMAGKQGVYTIGNGGGYGGFYCFALNP